MSRGSQRQMAQAEHALMGPTRWDSPYDPPQGTHPDEGPTQSCPSLETLPRQTQRITHGSAASNQPHRLHPTAPPHCSGRRYLGNKRASRCAFVCSRLEECVPTPSCPTLKPLFIPAPWTRQTSFDSSRPLSRLVMSPSTARREELARSADPDLTCTLKQNIPKRAIERHRDAERTPTMDTAYHGYPYHDASP